MPKGTVELAVPPLCPSAQPDMSASVVFAVVQGAVGKPLLVYLKEVQPATPDVLALAKPVTPTEVFRFAARCAADDCQHFDGSDCRLAKRVVDLLPAVAAVPPPCRLRPHCRWWRQEALAACLRCPQIVTETYDPSERLVEVSGQVLATESAEPSPDAQSPGVSTQIGGRVLRLQEGS